jgi:hypothetical protein
LSNSRSFDAKKIKKKKAFKEDGFKRLPGQVHHKELGHQSRKTRKQFTLPQYRISGHNKRDLIQRTFDCQTCFQK